MCKSEQNLTLYVCNSQVKLNMNDIKLIILLGCIKWLCLFSTFFTVHLFVARHSDGDNLQLKEYDFLFPMLDNRYDSNALAYLMTGNWQHIKRFNCILCGSVLILTTHYWPLMTILKVV